MTKYLKYIFAVSFFCNSIFADEIDSGWNNFQNSLLNDLSGMENSFSTIVEKYNTIDGKLSTIINYANSLPSDYSSIKATIVNRANECIQSCSYGIATVNDLRNFKSSMVNTISDMDYPFVSSSGPSSVDPSITNDLKKVVQHLIKIEEYDSWTLGKIQELIQTNRPIRDSMTNLLYFVQHNINSTISTINYNTSQISSNVSSILSELSTIESKFDLLATDVFGIRYTVNRFYTSFTSFLNSWLSHATHQDNFYSSATNQLNQIIASLANLNISNNYPSLDIDFSAITGILTNYPSSYLDELGIVSENLRITDYRYWSPNMTASGSFNNRYFYNTTLGDNLVRGSYYYILDDPENYNPFIIQLMLSLYNSSALTSLNNWQYLLHTNLVDLVQSSGVISGTLRNIDSSVRDISVSISTNNVILGQQLSRLDYIQSLFSNNVPIATLNHASWDWHTFFTNFYLYVSLGPENYNITNVGVSSTWHDSTNWFNRIEALLAALVFKDDNSGRVNTNVVSTSATQSAVSDVTTSLRSVVEIDNSFSQNVSSSASTIIDMLTEWTQQITASAQLNASFDMFSIPHMVTDDGQVHPEDSPASGDWAFRIGVQDNEFGDFIQFIRSLTTVLWLCVFMFFALKMSLFLLICICKFVYFCYVVFSAMMGGD